MGKSRTRKKSKKSLPPAVSKQVTNIATDYIRQWTQRELSKIQTQANPVCVPYKNGYMVGLYRVVINPNKTCDLLDHNREFVHRFENKVSAILYAIYYTKKQYYRADQIVYWNSEINKNYTDSLFLRRGIEKARKNQDYDAVDIRQSRLEIAENKLNLAREHISKIHKTAKYYKVWE
jgi:hypothetical protein